MLKKITRGFSSFAFKSCLFLLASVTAVVVVFGTSAHIKQAIKTSALYDSFVNNALDEAKKQQSKPSKQQQKQEENVPFDNPGIREAANKAFPPQLLQTSADKLLYGVYGWLDGSTQAPQFTIDLTEAKTSFANGVGDYAANRAKVLPVCTKAELQALGQKGIDFFTITCLPPGTNVVAERQKLVDQFLTNKDFFEKPVVTADNIPKNDQGQTIFQEASEAPKAFQATTTAPWVLGALALLFGLAVFFLSDTRRKAIRSIGITFFSTGVFLIIGFWIATFLINKLSSGNLASAKDNVLQQKTVNIGTTLAQDLNQVLLIFSIVYAAIGGVMLLILWFTRDKSHSSTSSEAEARVHHEHTKEATHPEPAVLKKDPQQSGDPPTK